MAPSGGAVNLDHEAEKVIAQFGSARAAVKELLLTNSLLENELYIAQATNSYGYTRGYHGRRVEGGA
jgi:hypothetical protein